MVINPSNLAHAINGFKALQQGAFEATTAEHTRIAMTVPSIGRDTSWAWLGQFPQFRKWVIGPRLTRQLEGHGFPITNVKFESTVKIRREDFADDQYGVFGKMFEEMGLAAKKHPDELVFDLLARGFTEVCHDGQFFFDTDLPHQPDLAEPAATVSNVQAGSGPARFLLDTSRPLRPLIWQEREPFESQQVTRPDDTEVFMTDDYLYAVRARVNAGFGIWQPAFGSKGALSVANNAAAPAAMMSRRGDRGRILGVMPNVLVVPPALEEAARAIVASTLNTGGGTNP